MWRQLREKLELTTSFNFFKCGHFQSKGEPIVCATRWSFFQNETTGKGQS